MIQPPQVGPLTVPPRILLGPGPSMLPPEVSAALAAPVIGHMDPLFFQILDEIAALLRYAFQTRNDLMLVIPGTGTAGMQAAVVNSLEPGDRIVVGVNGHFGVRIRDMALAMGADVVLVEAEWGKVIEPDQIRRALDRPTKVVALVHGETSTGVCQPLAEIGRIVREHDALFMVDAVASVGGVPLWIDEWLIDICYGGSQKCLAAPPGLAPITLSDRAVSAMRQRRTPQANYYLDLERLARYWSAERLYHHTSPVNLLYALREAGRLLAEEGLTARWERHARVSDELVAGLAELGLRPLSSEADRLKTVTAVPIPEGLSERAVRAELADKHNIEIGGGLGQFTGRMWRIGLMGYSCQAPNVHRLLSALAEVLASYPGDRAAALAGPA